MARLLFRRQCADVLKETFIKPMYPWQIARSHFLPKLVRVPRFRTYDEIVVVVVVVVVVAVVVLFVDGGRQQEEAEACCIVRHQWGFRYCIVGDFGGHRRRSFFAG